MMLYEGMILRERTMLLRELMLLREAIRAARAQLDSVRCHVCCKTHNSLESERDDKLTYPYINTHIFRRINAEVLARPVLDFYELTEEEVELEEELLYTEGMSDIDEFEGNES